MSNRTGIKQAGVRMMAIGHKNDRQIIVGKGNENVVAFSFANTGRNSVVTLEKDGTRFNIFPGQEKAFGLDGQYFFVEEFDISFRQELVDISSFNPLEASTEIKHECILFEMFEKGSQRP